MTPQQLKGSIIQLAIQGKLVPNCQDELITERYLRELQSQKHNLPKRKTKKKPALATINPDEIPFAIPRSWAWARLEWCCTKIVDGDHNPPPGKREPTPYLMLSAQNINQDSIVNLDRCRYLDKETFEKVNERTRAISGDILLTAVGTLGRTCIFDGSLNVCFQRSVTVITTLLYNKYLKLYLDSPFVLNYMASHSSATAQKGFYINKLQRLVCPIPPLEEQKRIVEKIESLMPLVDEYERTWNQLSVLNSAFPTVLKKTILRSAIKGLLTKGIGLQTREPVDTKQIRKELDGLVFKRMIRRPKPLPPLEEGDFPFEIPQNWVWLRLNDIGGWQSGATPQKDKREYYENGSIPWLVTGDLNNGVLNDVPGRITERALKETSVKLNPSGSVLIAMYGATIGKVAIADFECTTNQACCACIHVPSINKKFLFYYLLAMKDYFIGKGEGGAQPNISKEKIVATPFPVPPLDEQASIVEKIEMLLPLCERIEETISSR